MCGQNTRLQHALLVKHSSVGWAKLATMNFTALLEHYFLMSLFDTFKIV